MKKIYFICMVLIAAMCPFYHTYAKTADTEIEVSYRGIQVYIDGTQAVLQDAAGKAVAPFIYHDTTYLPIRAVAESLQMDVRWDQDTFSVYLTKSEKKEMKAGEPAGKTGAEYIPVSYRDIKVFVEGQELDLADESGNIREPFIYDGTTYLPLRKVAEAGNVEVSWDEKTSSIYLQSLVEIQRQSKYDTEQQTDMSLSDAEAYGFKVDMQKHADKNYAYITEYTGQEKDVLIPAKIEGKQTYMTGANSTQNVLAVFMGNEEIQSVTFEDNVKIANYLDFFRNCKNLRYVYNMPDCPSSATNCFLSCSNLLYVDRIPEGVTSIYNFYNGCEKITEGFNIPKSVKSAVNAFRGTKIAGEITCYSTQITDVTGIFAATKNDIIINIPAPSETSEAFAKIELPENVTVNTYKNEIVYLPEQIDAASFGTLDIYNYAVCPAAEKNGYELVWESDVITQTANGFTVKGSEDKVGEYPLTLTVKKDGKVLETKNSVIQISSIKNPKVMRVLTIGNRYAAESGSWMKKVSLIKPSITFVGSRTGGHEGRYGYTPLDYLTDFDYQGDKKGLNNFNPFFNPETKKFDYKYYKDYTSVSANAVMFFFGAENIPDLQKSYIEPMKSMIAAIRETDASIPIYVCLPVYRHKSTVDTAMFEMILQCRKEFSEYDNVTFINTVLSYDRDKNYNPKNMAYPNQEGYEQIAVPILSTLTGN